MSTQAGSQASDAPEGQPLNFYAARYAPERHAVQDAVFREVYDEYFGQSSWTAHADYDRFAGWLELTPDAYVLDVGCGAGAPALRMAERSGCAVVGTDSNAQALATATARARAQGLQDRVRFEHQDATRQLPFPDGAFDALVCTDAVTHLPDRSRIVSEWARVLKAGGRLLFTDQVLTGPITNTELAARSPSVLFVLTPPGHNERLLGEAGLELLRCEDLTANLAELARRHCLARQAHADALRVLEGDAVFEEQNQYRAVAERLARERRLSHRVFVARKPVQASGVFQN